MGARDRCCCISRDCTYFNDAFAGVVSGVDTNDWVVCDGDWQEDPSDLHEYSGTGSATSPVKCMSKTPHPTGASTVELSGFINISSVGQAPGFIFCADLPDNPDEGDCPTGYCYAYFEYLGATVYDGQTVYGKIVIGENGSEKWTTYVTTNFLDLNVTLTVRVNPLKSGKSQVYAYVNDENESCITCVSPGTGEFCGVGNFSSAEAHFAQIVLNEECETNPNCLENHCTLGETCVPNTLYATITNISCNTNPAVCLSDCPVEYTGADEGKTFPMVMPRVNPQAGAGLPVTYLWYGGTSFQCANNQSGTVTLACNGSVPEPNGATCGNGNRSELDFECSGSAGTTPGSLISFSESPVTFHYHGVEVSVNECCIMFDITITE